MEHVTVPHVTLFPVLLSTDVILLFPSSQTIPCQRCVRSRAGSSRAIPRSSNLPTATTACIQVPYPLPFNNCHVASDSTAFVCYICIPRSHSRRVLHSYTSLHSIAITMMIVPIYYCALSSILLPPSCAYNLFTIILPIVLVFQIPRQPHPRRPPHRPRPRRLPPRRTCSHGNRARSAIGNRSRRSWTNSSTTMRVSRYGNPMYSSCS